MVFIKSINKNIFPHYLPPEEDELFSSWLCRLAINHYVKPQTFIQNYFGKDFPIMNRDIDLYAPENLINILEHHTPLNNYDIRKMFLTIYESYAFEKVGEKGTYTNNILPLGINHRKRKRFGLSLCSCCLKNKNYYKKSWRLITYLICVECNQYLLDRCFSCSAPIAFHRINMSNNVSTIDFKPIYLCYNCNQDLRKYTPTLLPLPFEIKYQRFIDSTIQLGYNKVCSYSFFYIYTLLYLSYKVRGQRRNNRFKEAILSINHKLKKSSTIKEHIKYWTIEQRLETLPFIAKLLNNPLKLKKTLINGRVHKSYVDQDKVLPYWFIKNTIN